MAQQMSFFDLAPQPAEAVAHHGTPEERFLAFHEANPQVYRELRRLALQMRLEGVERYSIKGLFEVLRWQHSLKTRGDEFKLNNYFTSFYARLLMGSEPRLNGFFELRRGVHVNGAD